MKVVELFRRHAEDTIFFFVTILTVSIPVLLVFAISWGFYRDVQLEKLCATVCGEKGATVDSCVEAKSSVVARCSSPTEGQFVVLKKIEE